MEDEAHLLLNAGNGITLGMGLQDAVKGAAAGRTWRLGDYETMRL